MNKEPERSVLDQLNEAAKQINSSYHLDPGHAPRTWKDDEYLNDDNAMTWSK